jgi:hypothetical protein
MATPEKPTTKQEKVTEPPPGSNPVSSSTVAIPDKGPGKEDKRLFQIGSGEKKWLTKAEAEKAGKFWKD